MGRCLLTALGSCSSDWHLFNCCEKESFMKGKNNLYLILTILFLCGLVGMNLFHVTPDILSYGKGVLLYVQKSGIWRSARFARGNNFADYVEFLRKEIPEEGRVVLPPEEVTMRALSKTPFMQVFLSPREVINCTTVNCGSAFLEEDNTYLLVMGLGQFPAEQIDKDSPKVRMFNDTWGVHGPEDGLGNGTDPNQISSVWAFLADVVFPICVFIYFLFMGFHFARWLVPEYSPWFQIGVGYGLIIGLLSILVYISLLLFPAMELKILLFVYAVFWGAIYLFRTIWDEEDKFLYLMEFSGSFSIWVLFWIGLSAVLFFISVGAGYHTSDAIALWGAKGEGMSVAGLKAAGRWGTSTTNYPLLIPSSIAVWRSAFGNSLPASKMLFPGFYLAFLCLMYGYLIENVVKGWAGFCTIIFATLPIVVRHAMIGYANLPFAFFMAGGAILLFDSCFGDEFQNQTLRSLITGLFLIFVVWTRPEGIWLTLGVIISLVFFHFLGTKSRIKRSHLIAILISPILFWGLWKLTIKPYSIPEGVENLSKEALREIISGNFHFSSLAFMLSFIGSQAIHFQTWGSIGVGLFLSALLYPMRGREINQREGWFLLVGFVNVVIMIGIYYIFAFDSRYDISWWLNSGFNRMVMPGAFLILLSTILYLSPRKRKTLLSE